jgi:hypothetical protein
MAEQTHEPQPAQVQRPSGTAPPITAGTPPTPREEPAPKEPVRRETSPGDLITKHCEVLKESCENPADWIAKSADGAEIPVCDEHKPLVAINYPDVEFTYEEV